MNANVMTMKDYRVKTANRRISVNNDIIVQGHRIIEEWIRYFPRENTYAQQAYNVPSLLIGIDGIVQNGKLYVYEVEERPAGAGICSELSESFSDRLSDTKKYWPHFRFRVLGSRRPLDDHMWLNESTDSDRFDGPLLIRSSPDDSGLCENLERRSISSCFKEGDKSYGIQMGLWRFVRSTEQLDWDESFVLKPTQGTHCNQVVVWLSPRDFSRKERNKTIRGLSTQNQVIQAVESGPMYCQPLIMPLKSGINDYPWMIYRIFFGWNPVENKWLCIGGCGQARRTILVHGVSDAIIFPLELNE